MKQVAVTDASGGTWLVRRRWVPWALRWRGPRLERRKERKARSDPGWLDFLDFGDALFFFDDEGCFSVIGVIMAVVFAALIVFFVLPIALFLLELLLLALFLGVGVSMKIVLRRPWLVDAVSDQQVGRVHLIWKVVGWQRSGDVVDEIATALKSGVAVPHVRDAVLVSGT